MSKWVQLELDFGEQTCPTKTPTIGTIVKSTPISSQKEAEQSSLNDSVHAEPGTRNTVRILEREKPLIM